MTATTVSQVELDRIKAALLRAGELILLETVVTQFAMPWRIIELLRGLPLIVSRIQHLIAAVEVAGQQFFEIENRVAGNFENQLTALPELLAIAAAPIALASQTSPLRIKSAGEAAVASPPQSVGQLAARLQRVVDLEKPTIRVEKFVVAGGNRYVVYIPGVKQLVGGPLDLRSGVIEFSGQPSIVERAAEQALAKSGAGPSDRVTVVGHSLGGMAAVSLAERSSAGLVPYKVDAVVQIGSPVGVQEPISGAKILSVENAGDFVAKLDGLPSSRAQQTINIEQPQSTLNPLSNHSIAGYSEWLNSAQGKQTLGVQQDFAAVRSGAGQVSFYEFSGG